MKQTIKIAGSIWASKNLYSDGYYFDFFKCDFNDEMLTSRGYICISDYTIEIEMPEGLDLHKEQFKSLQNKRKLILAENEQRLNEIDNEIANFQAIEDKS